MIFQKYINHLKVSDKTRLLITCFIIGSLFYSLGSAVQYQIDQKIKYQGYTIKEWPLIANTYKTMWNESAKAAGACQIDPGSVECNIFNKFERESINCNQTIVTAGDIVWHYRNCSASIPTAQYVPQPQQTKPQETFMQQGKYLYGSNGSFCIPINGNQWSCQ